MRPIITHEIILIGKVNDTGNPVIIRISPNIAPPIMKFI